MSDPDSVDLYRIQIWDHLGRRSNTLNLSSSAYKSSLVLFLLCLNYNIFTRELLNALSVGAVLGRNIVAFDQLTDI